MQHIPVSLSAFYHDMWQLAMAGGSNNWARTTTKHPGPAGLVALVPRQYIAPEWIKLWPTLPLGDPGGEAGYVPTSDTLRDAFTAVLRTNGPSVSINPDIKRALHLAEQQRDSSQLTPAQADILLQVAVFGRVVFGGCAA
jgi:hypothetical protein